MAVGGGTHRIQGNLNITVCAVFEPHRAGQRRGHFPVHLRLCGARAYGSPADQVGNILAGHHIQKLGGGGQAQGVNVAQQLARQRQAGVHIKAAVKIWVVNQAFPAHYGAWLFKISTHHNAQFVGVAGVKPGQPLGVSQRCRRVVNGAGADNHQQLVALAGKNGFNLGAGSSDRIGHGIGQRVTFAQLVRSDQRGQRAAAQFVGRSGHGRACLNNRVQQHNALNITKSRGRENHGFKILCD